MGNVSAQLTTNIINISITQNSRSIVTCVNCVGVAPARAGEHMLPGNLISSCLVSDPAACRDKKDDEINTLKVSKISNNNL